MSVSSKAIIDTASALLSDTSNARWSTAQLVSYINAGQDEAVIHKPDAHSTTDVYQLSAGTKQLLPDGSNSFQNPSSVTLPEGIVLLDVSRNMGTNGTTAGRAVTIMDRYLMDRLDPDWHTDTAAAAVQYYMHDPRSPRVFYVYPPQPTSSMGYVEVIYSSKPTNVDSYSADEYIALADIYKNVLVDYVLYRAYACQNATSSNEKAAAYYQQFLNALLGKEQIENINDPNANAHLRGIARYGKVA